MDDKEQQPAFSPGGLNDLHSQYEAARKEGRTHEANRLLQDGIFPQAKKMATSIWRGQEDRQFDNYIAHEIHQAKWQAFNEIVFKALNTYDPEKEATFISHLGAVLQRSGTGIWGNISQRNNKHFTTHFSALKEEDGTSPLDTLVSKESHPFTREAEADPRITAIIHDDLEQTFAGNPEYLEQYLKRWNNGFRGVGGVGARIYAHRNETQNKIQDILKNNKELNALYDDNPAILSQSLNAAFRQLYDEYVAAQPAAAPTQAGGRTTQSGWHK